MKDTFTISSKKQLTDHTQHCELIYLRKYFEMFLESKLK